MVKQTLWVERRFNFDYPIGIFPCVVERMRGTPARLEEIVRHSPPAILTRRFDGGWSIQEQAGHLWDLEALWEKRLNDFRSGAAVLTAADMTNRKTHEANHNAAPIQKILEEFRKARRDLVSHLEVLTDEEVGRSSLHPRLNIPMRLVDWCYFMAEHDDHHIARIVALGRNRT